MANDKQSKTGISENTEGQLTVDVYQTPEAIIVEATLAGVKSGDLDIDITSELITIKGERKRDVEVSDSDYFYQELFWGKFSRLIILPEEIDTNSAESSMKDGVLIIKLPKLKRESGGKKLRIKTE